MHNPFLRLAAILALVATTSYFSYKAGQRKMLSGLRSIDREMVVLEYRIEALSEGYAECLDTAEYYKDSALAANRLLVATDSDYEGVGAMGGD